MNEHAQEEWKAKLASKTTLAKQSSIEQSQNETTKYKTTKSFTITIDLATTPRWCLKYNETKVSIQIPEMRSETNETKSDPKRWNKKSAKLSPANSTNYSQTTISMRTKPKKKLTNENK